MSARTFIFSLVVVVSLLCTAHSVCPQAPEECTCLTEAGGDLKALCEGNTLTYIPRLPGNLKELSMFVTMLDNIASANLTHLVALERLNFTHSVISDIEAGAFDNIINLRQLSFIHGKLTRLPDGIFDKLSSLESLYLTNNDISHLSMDLFSSLSNLITLHLDQNRLSYIDAFPPILSNLKTLSIKYNPLLMISAEHFRPLTSLTSLDVSYNKLQEIGEQPWDLKNLRYLSLAGNRISVVNSGAFDELTSLQELDLSFNTLTIFRIGRTGDLPNLHSLDLSSNFIDTFREGYLERGASNLRVLKLNKMMLLSIEERSFASLKQLEHLEITGNPKLTTFFPGCLEGQISLTSVDLSSNSLDYLHPDTFVGSKPLLSTVHLNRNAFHCNCSLAWMASAANQYEWASDWKDIEPPYCTSPHHLSTIPDLWGKIAKMYGDDFTCKSPEIERLTPEFTTVYKKESTRFQAKLLNGIPISKWMMPNGKIISVPRRPSKVDNNSDLAITRPQENVTKGTEQHIMTATLDITPVDHVEHSGTYTLFAENGVGTVTMTFNLEVLPQEASGGPCTVYVCTQAIVLIVMTLLLV